MDFKSLHFQSVACPRMRTLVLQTMDFQSIVVDYYSRNISCDVNKFRNYITGNLFRKDQQTRN